MPKQPGEMCIVHNTTKLTDKGCWECYLDHLRRVREQVRKLRRGYMPRLIRDRR